MTSTTAIQARDFSTSTADKQRDSWADLGKMRHLIAALDGAEVLVVAEQRTGFTVQGRIVSAFNGGPSRGPRVGIETTLDDGTTHLTTYYAHNIGPVIIVLPGHGKGPHYSPNFTAVRTYRDEASAALRLARQKAEAELGAPLSGGWSTTVLEDAVHVSCARDNGVGWVPEGSIRNDTFRWWPISLRELAAASV